MANLGNLWFSLMLKDETQKDIEAAMKRLEKLNVKMKLGIDESEARQSIQKALDGQTYKANVDVVVRSASVQDAIQRAFAQAGVNMNTTAADVRNQRILEVQARMEQQRAINAAKQRAQEERAALVAARREEVQQRTLRSTEQAAVSTEKLNTSLRSQSSILTTLGNQIGTVFSVYSLQRFAMNLINIGGEFQKQRIALRAMLGDAQKADKIFSQMRGLAVESPFTFLELASYTKQLEAFSIPYDELYETTKRLADISAGLGVPMERIILAYGQVRAASFLRGQEVRQFTEAGIPLLEKLAEKFSILENRAVSVGEVFNYISKRKVPFQMVKDVLWDLTDEGGQFFDMQSELVESLSGKWGKLRDTMQIMFSDIADANNNIIGGALDGMIALVNRWQDVANAIGPVVVAYGTYRAALAASIVLENASATAKRLNAIAGKEVTAATILCTNATKGLGKAFSAISAHPWALLISTIATVGTVIYNAYQNATKLDREITKTLMDSYNTFSKERDDFKDLVAQLGKAVVGTQNYNEIREKIQSRYGQYLGNLDNEKDLYEQLRDKIDDVTEALKARYAEEARQSALTKVYDEDTKNLSDTFDSLVSNLENGLGLGKQAATRLAGELKRMIEAGDVSGLTGDYETLRDTLVGVADLLNLDISRVNMLSASATSPGGFAGLLSGTGGAGSTTRIQNNLKELVGIQEKLNKDLDETKEKNKALWGENANYGEELARIEEEYSKRIKEEAQTDEDRLRWTEEMYDAQIAYLENLGKQEWVLAKIREIEKARAALRQPELPGEENTQPGKGDPTADRWKKRIDLLKEAMTEYEKWSKVIGKEAAVEKLQGNPIFASLGTDFDFSEARNAIREYLKEIENQATTDKQRSLVLSLQKAVLGFEYDEDKEALDKALKDIQKQIDATVKKWDLYKKIFDSTGNKDVAIRFAFGGEMKSEDLASELKAMIEDALQGTDISLNDVMTFDDKEFEEKSLKGIQAIVKAYKDEQKKMEEDQLESLLRMIENSKDYAAKIKDIQTKLDKDLKNLNDNRADLSASGMDVDAMIAQRQKQADQEIASTKFAAFRESELYARMFDDIEKMGTRSIGALLKQMKELKETAAKDLPLNEFKELTRQMNKLEEAQIERNPFKGFGENMKGWASAIRAVAEARREYAVAEREEAAAQRMVDAVQAAYKELGLDKEEKDVFINVTYKGIDGKDVQETISLAEAQNKLRNATEKTSKAAINLAKSEDDENEAGALLAKRLSGLNGYIDEVKSTLSGAENMFDALGMEDAVEEMEAIGVGLDALSAGISAVAAYAKGDYMGAATGAINMITGFVTSLVNLHDNSLNKAIERSKERVEELENAYDQMAAAAERALGGSVQATERSRASVELLAKQVASVGSSLSDTYSGVYSSLYDSNDFLSKLWKNLEKFDKNSRKLYNSYGLLTEKSYEWLKIMEEAVGALDAVGYNYDGGNSVYMAQYADLVAQRAELEAQLAAEEDEKKTDSGVVADLQDQIYELNEEIAYFVQDLVKDLYDIDFDDWASQISSSLMDAFRNGEDAVEAFGETAGDILADVAEDILRIGILEPMMQDLQDALFGVQDSNGNFTGGIIDLNDLENTMYTGMEYIADWFNTEGKSVVEAMQNGYEYLDQLTGGIMSTSTTSSGLSAGIQGITEETADLLASYVNAIRADVSVIRMLEEQFFGGDELSQMNVIAQAQLSQLNAIAANTERNAEYAGELRDMVSDMITGTKKLSIK